MTPRQATQTVQQRVQILDGEQAKFDWLSKNLLGLLALSQQPEKQQQQCGLRPPPTTVAEAAAAGGVVFCNSQQRVEDLAFLLEGVLAQLVEADGRAAHGSATAETATAPAGDAASRAAAARLLGGESSQDLRKNANQTFKCKCDLYNRGGEGVNVSLAVSSSWHSHALLASKLVCSQRDASAALAFG